MIPAHRPTVFQRVDLILTRHTRTPQWQHRGCSSLLLSCCLLPAAIMIIYWDLISHDEMFSYIYEIREMADGLCLEVEGKMVSKTEGDTDDSLIGENASTEGLEGEGTKSTLITGIDIVMNHHLQETSFTKESYKKCIKDYMKSIKGNLKNRDQQEYNFL